MSNDPLSIPLSKLIDLLRELGLDPVDPSDIKSIHAEHGAVTVVRCRRDEAGQQVIAGDEVCTETVTIGIEVDR